METESLSLVAVKSEKYNKLEQKYISLKRDFEIFQASDKYIRSRRCSESSSNSITQLLETSPRTLMSSLQDSGSSAERVTTIENGGMKGRSLFVDFENAVDVCGSYVSCEIEDCGSGKQGICENGFSWSGSCFCYEKVEVDMEVKRDEFRRGLICDGFNLMGLMVIIFGFVYMICNGGVYGDEDVRLIPT